MYNHFDDVSLVDFAARELNVSSFQILKSALIVCNDQLYETHLDAAFESLICGVGNMPQRYRQYIINLLAGTSILIVDTAEGIEAILLA